MAVLALPPSANTKMCGRCKARILHPLPDGKADIAPDIVEPLHAITQVKALLRNAHVPKIDSGFSLCVFAAQAVSLQFVRFQLKMCLDLVRQIIAAAFVI